MTESKPADCCTYCTYINTESHTSLCYCVLPHCQVALISDLSCVTTRTVIPKKKRGRVWMSVGSSAVIYMYLFKTESIGNIQNIRTNNNQRFLSFFPLLFPSFPPLSCFVTVDEGVLAPIEGNHPEKVTHITVHVNTEKQSDDRRKVAIIKTSVMKEWRRWESGKTDRETYESMTEQFSAVSLRRDAKRPLDVTYVEMSALLVVLCLSLSNVAYILRLWWLQHFSCVIGCVLIPQSTCRNGNMANSVLFKN